MELPPLPPGWLDALPSLGLSGTAAELAAAALASAVATLALVAGFAPHRLVGGSRHERAPADETSDFLINGASIRPLTESARMLLDGLPPGGTRLAALAAHLAGDCPDFPVELEALVLYGTGFRRHCPRGDGTAVELIGEPRGGSAFLSVRPASEEARALREAQGDLARTAAEFRFLRSVLDRAPVLAWSQGPDGQVTWASAAYRARFDPPAGDLPDHRIADGFGHVLEQVPLTPRSAGEARRRVAVPGRVDGEPHWYEVSQAPGDNGETLGFALEVDDLVAAEASLRRFVETLTETFAHLPIGLAVFDKNRRLGLFNPALTDLVKIDAVWLAGRPSLRDFLERLRETRQMPEQKDFAAWRRKLSELEEGARSGTYEEHWQLPSGKIFRVTGRPHPQGALAFLFEDISTAITLERKYRSELELSQATLDRISDAVAVFDASGMLVFVNAAFEALWGLDPMERLDGPDVSAMTRLWAERSAPSPAWDRVAEFTTSGEARSSWSDTVETADGRTLDLLVAPLPDASALVVFRPAAHSAAGDGDGIDALALEAIRLPVEAAVTRLSAAIPTAASPDAFQALSATAQVLKDGLARADELATLGRGSAGAPLAGLTQILAARGLALSVPAGADDWPVPKLRAALALGLAATDLAAPGGSVALSLEPGGVRAALAGPVGLAAAGASAAGIRLALARRLVAAVGGSLEVRPGGGGTTLHAVLPDRLAGQHRA